jgi:hypothetical protein
MSYDSSNDRCNECGHAEHACRCGVGENSIWFGGDDVDVRAAWGAAHEFGADEEKKDVVVDGRPTTKGAVIWRGTGVKWVAFDDMTEKELEKQEHLHKLLEDAAHELGGLTVTTILR